MSGFNLAALYDALDEKRRALGLSWQAAAREIGRISSSTLSGMLTRRFLEGDGVLQMLLWLDRTPESLGGGLRGTVTQSALQRHPSRTLPIRDAPSREAHSG